MRIAKRRSIDKAEGITQYRRIVRTRFTSHERAKWDRDPGRLIDRSRSGGGHRGSLMQNPDISEEGENIELTEVWWEALGPPALHPICVPIIEALRWIDEPLHAIDLREMVDRVAWAVLEHHLKHLKVLGAVALVEHPSRHRFFARYRLVLEPAIGD
jgi:hypothetical protein